MDGNAVTRLFATRRHSVSRWVWLAGLLVVLFPTFVTHLLLWRIERRLDLKIYGKPYFVLFPGSIQLHGAFLDWPGRFRVRSGRLSVWYPLVAVLQGKFSIVVKGSDVVLDIGPELQKVIGQDEVAFERLSAKFLIHSRRDIEIDHLDAESKTLEFHLSNKPRQRADGS